jgi:hypothetical protein
LSKHEVKLYKVGVRVAMEPPGNGVIGAGRQGNYDIARAGTSITMFPLLLTCRREMDGIREGIEFDYIRRGGT